MLQKKTHTKKPASKDTKVKHFSNHTTNLNTFFSIITVAQLLSKQFILSKNQNYSVLQFESSFPNIVRNYQ